MLQLQKDEWDAGAEWWHKKAGIDGPWHQEHDIDPVIFELIGSVKGKSILDAGCGNGYLSRKLSRQGAHMTAVDLSAKLIEQAQRLEGENPTGVSYLVRDAAHLTDISDGSFDIVIGNMSVMDIADIQGAMNEFRRVLKRGGVLVFSLTHPAFFDFHQEWGFQSIEAKKYFSRSVPLYLGVGSERRKFSEGFSVTQYHRPISAYVEYLKRAGFAVHDLKEIATSDLPVPAQQSDGDVTRKRSKYTDQADYQVKSIASKEIPFFLVIKACSIDRM